MGGYRKHQIACLYQELFQSGGKTHLIAYSIRVKTISKGESFDKEDQIIADLCFS